MASPVHCSISLATGELLLDGKPPGRLPAAFVKSTDFHRVFARRNFDVYGEPDARAYRTLLPIAGCSYRFKQTGKGGPVVICELSPRREGVDEEPTWLQLLPMESNGNTAWSAGLPLQLRMLYSAWSVPDKDATVLRGPFASHKGHSYSTREVAFVWNAHGLWRPADPVGSDWRKALCMVDSKRADELRCPQDSSSSTDKMDQAIDSLLLALEGVERRDFVHLFVTHKQALRAELPRYNNDAAFETYVAPDGAVEWRSVARPAYVLATEQLLADRLRGFGSYIVLRLSPRTDAERLHCMGKPSTMLLLPAGDVQPGAGRAAQPHVGLAHVPLPEAYTEEMRFAVIEWNDAQEGWTVAETQDRLMLVAILAHVHTALPERGRLPAAQALDLLRATAFEPLSAQNVAMLRRCFDAAQGIPVLRLRCWQLCDDASLLSFCNGEYIEASLPRDVDAETLCLQAKQRHGVARALWLTASETRRIFANEGSLTPEAICRESHTQLPKLQSLDKKLAALVTARPPPAAQGRAEEEIGEGASALAKHFEREAATSREAQRKVERPTLSDQAVAKAQALAEDWLPKLEKWLDQHNAKLDALLRGSTHPADASASAVATLACAVAPHVLPSVLDVLRLMWCRGHAARLVAPGVNLTRTLYALLRKTALGWADIAATKQRLSRVAVMARLAQDTTSATEAQRLHARGLLLYELEACRLYDAGRYPWWLAMEVASNITIRRKQVAVAKLMIAGHGHNVQLNMGEGKTSVILPLLALHFAHAPHDEPHVPRAIFPPELVSAGAEQLRQHLTRGASQLPVVSFGFHRQATFDAASMGRLGRLVWHLRTFGGVMVAAPNNVLSANLKCDELQLA